MTEDWHFSGLIVVVALGILLMLSTWRRTLIALLLWFATVDLIRKFAAGSIVLLILSDALALYLFVQFYVGQVFVRGKRIRAYIPRTVIALLALFALLIVFQALNPSIPEFVLRIGGLRAYLLYIPALGLGLFWIRSETDIRGIYRFLVAISVPIIMFSFYQALLNPDAMSAGMSSMDVQAHSYGDYSFTLICSSFASSKRYGRFLFIVYPLIYGLSVYLKKSRPTRIITFVLFLLAAVVSGSREVVVMILLFQSLYWLASFQKHSNRMLVFGVLVTAACISWQTILNFDHLYLTEENFRGKAVLANQEEWKSRLLQSYTDLIRLSEQYSASDIIWGNGIGTYGREAGLIGDQDAARHLGINRLDGDSGALKLVIELGIFGFVYFVFMYLILLKTLWAATVNTKGLDIFPVAFAAFFNPLGWIILFSKAHTVVSDGMLSFSLWFAVGMILALSHYARTGEFPVNKSPACLTLSKAN